MTIDQENRIHNLEIRLESVYILQQEDQKRIDTLRKKVEYMEQVFKNISQVEEHLYQAFGAYAHSDDEKLLYQLGEALKIIQQMKKGKE